MAATRQQGENVIHVDFGRRKRAAPSPASTVTSSDRVASPPSSRIGSSARALVELGTTASRTVRERDVVEAGKSRRKPAAAPTRRRDPTGDFYSRAEVSRLFGIPESRLRYWDRTGFLAPSGGADGRPLYTFQDLISVRAAKSLLERGTPLRRVRRSVDALRAALPSVIRPLAELRISADGDRILVHTERAKWEPTSGQLELDFDVRDLRDEVVRVLRPDRRDPSRRRAAYEAYLEGARLDEEPATFDRAEAAYRRAIELDPSFGHAFTNLGNLRYRRGDVEEAEALYRRALAVDPTQPEALYNLGYIASDRGDLSTARELFTAALQSDPAFADAQFNLAMTLEALGEREEARAHWRAYLALEPAGEWAEVARRHLR